MKENLTIAAIEIQRIMSLTQQIEQSRSNGKIPRNNLLRMNHK